MAQKIDIPKTLPKPLEAVRAFCEWRDEPNDSLLGLKLLDTFGTETDIDQVWVVGSSAWFPALFGKPIDRVADVDVIFGVPQGADVWSEMLHAKLQERNTSKRFDVVRSWNKMGGWKLSRGGITLVDCWNMEEDVTIHEEITKFEREHEKVAFRMDCSPNDPSGMIRVIKKPKSPTKGSSVSYSS